MKKIFLNKKIIYLIMTIIFVSCTNLKTVVYINTVDDEAVEIKEFDIDNNSFASINKDSRIKSIIIHYTASDNTTSLRTLTQGDVSVHYLVPDTDDDTIFSLVPEEERAWHAGDSNFAKRSAYNDSSIGIEIVNRGYGNEFKSREINPEIIKLPIKKIIPPVQNKIVPSPKEEEVKFRATEEFGDYTQNQIEKVVYLIAILREKYGIEDKYILGHSDVAPQRKSDPGPKFPWGLIYDKYGIGRWYDEKDKEEFLKPEYLKKENILTVKKLFRDFGYDMNSTNKWDVEAQKVIYAFQAHYRPEKITGKMDRETYAIIKALNFKYNENM